MIRFFALLALGLVTACTNPNDLDEVPAYMGNFHLGHNVVVAPNLVKGPVSREASKEEWVDAVTQAITDRFGRFDGTKLYHLGVSVEGYVLAVPGVPVVASPKSALILNVTVWDDAAGKKLNEKPHLVTVVESLSTNTILGSGLTQSRDKQMLNLSRNAAKIIQNWLVQNNNEYGWFEDDGRPAKEKIGILSGRPETEDETVPSALPDDPAVLELQTEAESAADAGSGVAVAEIPPAE